MSALPLGSLTRLEMAWAVGPRPLILDELLADLNYEEAAPQADIMTTLNGARRHHHPR